MNRFAAALVGTFFSISMMAILVTFLYYYRFELNTQGELIQLGCSGLIAAFVGGCFSRNFGKILVGSIVVGVASVVIGFLLYFIIVGMRNSGMPLEWLNDWKVVIPSQLDQNYAIAKTMMAFIGGFFCALLGGLVASCIRNSTGTGERVGELPWYSTTTADFICRELSFNGK